MKLLTEDELKYLAKGIDRGGFSFSRDDMIAVCHQARLALRYRKALEEIDKWWFDASSEDGACSSCDVSLVETTKGKHQQLNGHPCPFQIAHEALEEDGE